MGHSQIDSLSRTFKDTIILQSNHFGQKTIKQSVTEVFIIENSIQIKSIQEGKHERTNIPYVYHPFSHEITIDSLTISQLQLGDSILLTYRFYKDILPDTLGRTYKTGIESMVSYISLDIPKNTENKALMPEGVNYSGSFGRGLTAGNSQSLVLNSTFNLQLGGKIGDGIDLRAVISDANIPIQAEGTTQNLQEFDQVFIELKKGDQKLIAGDYTLERPSGYFLNYRKKLKGIQYSHGSIYDAKGNLSVSGSFAISGGKFSRNTLNTKEGNQGPYKLQGADNEQFIIVQSGSEKIYIDGKLLTRGENNDYSIFYDRAELVFTEKQPITKDSRVIVEFEYLAQNYARTISTANADWGFKKHTLSFRTYNETDNKNSTGISELTKEDKTFLQHAGDNQEDRFKQSIYINEKFDQNSVFYKTTTTVEGDTILEFSTDPDSAIFQANFTDLGENKGDYSIDNTNNINGRVYKYVGKGEGRYLPVKKLLPPETKQMYSFRDEYQYKKNGNISTEISISNFDKNLFSELDVQDNIGYAIRSDWSHLFTLEKKKRKKSPDDKPKKQNQDQAKKQAKVQKHKIQLDIFGEAIQKNFKVLNPFRNAEFSRDWNLEQNDSLYDEIMTGSSISWKFNKNQIQYQLNTLNIETDYAGYKQTLSTNFSNKNTFFTTSSSYLKSKSTRITSRFIRPTGSVDHRWTRLNSIHTGIEYEGEYNNKNDIITDTLYHGSREYDQIKTYISTDQEKKVQATVFYTKRLDRIGIQQEQLLFSNADNYGTSLHWSGKKQALNLNINYRVLEVEESFNQDIKDAKNVLGGIDYQYNLWDGLVRGVSNINFNSGQEPKREFDYREVGLGEGNYVWIDNGDGVQEKNEFHPAPFSDQGNFIQISLFNNEFVQVYKQDYSQTLRINPIKWKLSKQKWKKKLSKLSSQTSLRLSRKDLQEEGLPNFNIFKIEENNPALISYVSSINQSLYWNRGNPSYDIQFIYLKNKNSLLLTTGNEQRNNGHLELKYRQNIKKIFNIEISIGQVKNSRKNTNFPINDYRITGYNNELQTRYRYHKNTEFRVNFELEKKENILGIEKANSGNLTAGYSYSKSKKIRVDINTTYNRINYTKSENPSIELVMLEGLKDGNNFLWEIRVTKRLINNFDLTLNYNGRKTGETKVVHVANAQIKATF